MKSMAFSSNDDTTAEEEVEQDSDTLTINKRNIC